MHPPALLPQLILERVVRAEKELRERWWSRVQPLTVLASPPADRRIPVEDAAALPLAEVAPGEHFSALDRWQHRWFRVTIPESAPAESGLRHLRWRCQGETTAYLHGTPWAGLDVGHPTCPIPDEACELWMDCGCWVTGIWVPGAEPVGPRGLRFDGADLAIRDELAWAAHWDLECWRRIAEVLWLDEPEGLRPQPPEHVGWRRPLDELAPVLRLVLDGLDRAVAAWKRVGPAALQREIAALARRVPAAPWQPHATIVGHAHIDCVWLWPQRVAQHKLIHVAATIERLVERYPEFVFSQTTPALYRELAAREPAQFERIRALSSQGRWEATGAMEVESDTLIPCGEALVRSVRLGQAWLTHFRGEPSRVCWLPDTFGYSAALPMILAQSGVEAFFTTKLQWNAVNRFPHTAFNWQSPDGSSVVAHLSPGFYTEQNDPAALRAFARRSTHLPTLADTLVGTGWGDGGGGPTDWMCERARRLASVPGVPRVRWGSAESFFERLHAVRDQLPTWQGELYLEYHRGTLTTQAACKLAYRRLERALQAHEAARAWAGLAPHDDEHPWRRAVFAQFHDALPGSSIAKVYAELVPELEALALTELNRATACLGAPPQSGPASLFNPVAMPRRVVHEYQGALVLTAFEGLGVAPAGNARPTHPVAPASPRTLTNRLITAEFDERGALAQLRAASDPEPRLHAPAQIVLYHDLPAKFDAWDIDHDALAHRDPLSHAVALRVEEQGPLRAALEGHAPVGQASRLRVRYEMRADDPWLEIVLTIDWREADRMLRLEWPTTCHGESARFGCAFGSVRRAQRRGPMHAEAQWEVAGSRWAIAERDDGAGLAIVTEAKWGFSCRDGILGVTLLRAPRFPDPAADRGEHTIRLALRPSRGPIDVAEVAREAEGRSAPLLSVAEAPSAPRVCVSPGATLVPAWVEPTADGFNLRLHEVAGAAGDAEVMLDAPPADARLVDLVGRPVSRGVTAQGPRVVLPYRPYELLTLRITRESRTD